MKHPWLIGIGTVVVLLSGWMIHDLTSTERHSLRRFDPHEVARLETDMWRSYYDRRRVSLAEELVELLRQQYHLPFWKSVVGAVHAARAAAVFQDGHNRGEYERALPDLVSYYQLIHDAGEEPFDVDKTARLELEWWIVHRERAQHPRADLDRSLADLQAAIYQRPSELFAEHASARAEAMLIRDTRQEEGKVTEQDWARIGALLDASWTSLQAVVGQAASLLPLDKRPYASSRRISLVDWKPRDS